MPASPPSALPSLGAHTMKKQTQATSSAKLVVDAYCTTVLEQPTLALDKVPDLSGHQVTAKQNATNWQTKVAPLLIQTNTDLLDFSHNFASFYNPLYSLAQNIDVGDNRAQFIHGLQILTRNIEDKQKNSQTALDTLTDFRGLVLADHNNFSHDIQIGNSMYEGDQGEIATLQARNDALQSKMSQDLTIIGLGATAVVVGGLIIAVGLLAEIPTAGASTVIVAAGIVVVAGGTVAMGIAGADYTKSAKEYSQNLRTIATDQAEIAVLHGAGDQLGKLVTANESAVDALDTMVKTWQTLGSEFNGVIDQLQNRVDPNDGPWLVSELGTAKLDWDDVTTTAELINKQCSSVPVVDQTVSSTQPSAGLVLAA
ncbi:MAG TPA: HBL/NHE enterotoxin family protein [Thermoleophilaceae bacterium]|nr:HBL/NHE enterotoxin family protein [Thermoleophilaceae bacterium]